MAQLVVASGSQCNAFGVLGRHRLSPGSCVVVSPICPRSVSRLVLGARPGRDGPGSWTPVPTEGGANVQDPAGAAGRCNAVTAAVANPFVESPVNIRRPATGIFGGTRDL